MDQLESGNGIEYFLSIPLIKRKNLQPLGSDRDYCMTSNEDNLMKQLTSYVFHCYDNEIAMHESFTFIVFTKEDFNAFKETCISEATAPTKVERRLPQPDFPTKKDHSFTTSKE